MDRKLLSLISFGGVFSKGQLSRSSAETEQDRL